MGIRTNRLIGTVPWFEDQLILTCMNWLNTQWTLCWTANTMPYKLMSFFNPVAVHFLTVTSKSTSHSCLRITPILLQDRSNQGLRLFQLNDKHFLCSTHKHIVLVRTFTSFLPFGKNPQNTRWDIVWDHFLFNKKSLSEIYINNGIIFFNQVRGNIFKLYKSFLWKKKLQMKGK